jgi:hypothetical protein
MSFLDTSAVDPGSDLGNISDALGSAPSIDLSSLGSTPSINLSAAMPSQLGGGTSIVQDLTQLLGVAGTVQAQTEAAKAAAALAAAKQANALQTIQTTPNVWLVLGLGAVGIFALAALHSPAAQSATSRR